MGRPDLSEQRTAEILDAFERCVGKYGIEGSSLESVANEAGMKRSILRHYIGNRDELVDAFAERVMNKYADELEAAFSTFQNNNGTKALLDYLFPTKTRSDSGSLMVIESLIAAAEKYPKARTLVSEYVEELTRRTAELLRNEHPTTSRQRCWNVAYGLVGICFNQESLGPLKLPSKHFLASRACARLLIDTLQST